MNKKYIIGAILVSVAMVIACGYLGYRYNTIQNSDIDLVMDFSYKENEIHKLTFNFSGDRSCPEIPVKIGDEEFNLGFDTGCGTGIFLTDILKDKIKYTNLGESEALNRDGSHRSWDKRVSIDKISVFGEQYENIDTSISDWTMYSSHKFNGTIGLAYFKSKTITLDYRHHRIAVSSKPINYTRLNSDKYVILPLHKTTSENQKDLPFFVAELNGRPIMVYLDTGKNYSYIYNTLSKHSMSDKPAAFIDVPLKLGNIDLMLHDVVEANDMAQAEGLPYPTMVELNSDQIWKCNLLVTFDMMEKKIILCKSKS